MAKPPNPGPNLKPLNPVRPTRKVIYVDASDDIAAIIETVKASKSRIICLVPPKRDDIFNSIVNLKLLAAVAHDNNRQIVLITTDPTTINLAGRLDLWVSANLKQKPKIPTVDSKTKSALETSNQAIDIDIPGRSKPKRKRRPKSDIKPTPVLTTKTKKTTSKTTPKRRPKKARKTDKNRPAKRIDFHRHFAWLTIAFIIATLVGAVWYLYPDTKVIVDLKTDIKPLTASLTVGLSSQANQPSVEGGVNLLPLVTQTGQQNLTQPIIATGRKDVGTQAEGEITVTNCQPSQRLNLPINTIFIREELEFVSLSQLTLEPGNDDCVASQAEGNIGQIRVRARKIGDKYNLQANKYDIKGQTEGDYKARGGDMSGGSSERLLVISQVDINKAQTLLDGQRDDDQIKNQLSQQLQTSGYRPLEATYRVERLDLAADVEVGAQATSGVLKQTINYYLGGISYEHLGQLIGPELDHQAGELLVIDKGLKTADYNLIANTESEGPDYQLEVVVRDAQAAVDLDEQSVWELIRGQPTNQAASELRRRTGNEVNISITPSWAIWKTKVPTNPDQVEIRINQDSPDA